MIYHKTINVENEGFLDIAFYLSCNNITYCTKFFKEDKDKTLELEIFDL